MGLSGGLGLAVLIALLPPLGKLLHVEVELAAFLAAGLAIAAIALGACVVPVARAMRIRPMEALRHE